MNVRNRCCRLIAGLPLVCAMCVAAAAAGLDPSLCVVVEDAQPVIGQPIAVRIELGLGDPFIVGGQYSLRYDPAVLQFNRASPGTVCDPTSPFSQIVALNVNEAKGQIGVAIAVGFGDDGTQGPAAMGCLSFLVIGNVSTNVCLVTNGPYPVSLTSRLGEAVTPFNEADCPGEPPAISCDLVPTPISNYCQNMDTDNDGDIDLMDYAGFQRCIGGPANQTRQARWPDALQE